MQTNVPYGRSGILVWLACAVPAPMRGFPFHRGQASGMQCGHVRSAAYAQLYGWCGSFVWLTCAGLAPMLGFPLHRDQASGMQCGDVCRTGPYAWVPVASRPGFWYAVATCVPQQIRNSMGGAVCWCG